MLSEMVQALRQLDPPRLQERLRELLPQLGLADRFSLLHELGVYHHHESISGEASSLRETAALRAELPRLVEGWRVASILDVPCGDFYWLQRVPLRVEYTGADIVPGLVATNQRLHGSPTRRFVVLDAAVDPLPAVDLILCRDLLIHLSNADCRAVLANIAASKSRLLLTNHFAGRPDNPDILSGDFRPINLCNPPFSFRPPIAVISENSELGDGAFRDRSMALWSISELSSRLGVKE